MRHSFIFSFPSVTILMLVVMIDSTSPEREQSRPPEVVSFHVIAHVKLRRDYSDVLDGVVKKARQSPPYFPLFQHFNPQGTFIKLADDNPENILKAFCEVMFNQTSTAVLHIINPFRHLRSWNSMQFTSNLLHHVGLPVITWGPEYVTASGKVSSEALQIQISPTLHDQAAAMLSLLDAFNWQYFSVVHTTYSGHQEFLNAVHVLVLEREKLLQEDTFNRKSRIRFQQILEVEIQDPDTEVAITRDLSSIASSDTRVILLFAHEQDTRSILTVAEALGIMGSEYVWITAFEAIPQGTEDIAADLPVGLLGLRYSADEKEMREAVRNAGYIWLSALNTSYHASLTGSLPLTLPALSCSASRSQPLFWPDGKRFFEHLRDAANRNPDTDNEDDDLRQSQLSIVNVQPEEEGRARWKKVGVWTRSGLTMDRIQWLGGATGPPSGKPQRHRLRVVTRPEEPYVMYRNLTDNKTCDNSTSTKCKVFVRDDDGNKLSNTTVMKCCTGLSIELLLRVSHALNFDAELYEVEDFQWGAQDKNGNWDGLIRELRQGQADMAVTSLHISEERSKAVNFSVPYLETGITIIVAIRDGAISATAFLEPYDYPSWCLILVFSVHTVGASIFVFEWFSPYGLDRGRSRPSEHKFSLFRTFWLMWAMLFGAAVSTNTPRGVSGRFLANIWALFALVFLASYTANLAAFMITKEEYYDLSGIQDWRLQNPQWMKPSFKYGTIPNTTTESNIRKNNRDMYMYMQKYRQNSVHDAIYALKTHRIHAFIYDATVLEYQAGKDVNCRLITVGKWYAMSGYGIAFPVGSKWIQKVNSIILDLQQKGEMERLQDFWLAGACHTKRKKSENNKGITSGVSSSTLGILNFTSAFILLGAGTGLAALTFALEHCIFWFGRRRLSNWDKKGCCALISLSMGMTVSFQQSVHDALQLHRSHRCRNSVCKRHLWRAHQSLDMARIQIDRLQRRIALLSIQRERPDVWTYDPQRAEQCTGPQVTPTVAEGHRRDVAVELLNPRVTLL